MTWKKKIEDLLDTGKFTNVQKLMLVLYAWSLGKISDLDASSLFSKCGFTFTKPTATGQTILTDGTTLYTISALITAYHDSYYPISMWSPDDATTMIDDLKDSGHITTDEQTALKGLGW